LNSPAEYIRTLDAAARAGVNSDIRAPATHRDGGRRMNGIRADRWRRLRPLLDRAIELQGDARKAYLDGLRGGDEEYRRDIERLLAQHEALKDRTPATAMALVTLALSRDERHDESGDRAGLSPTGAYPMREFGADARGDAATESCWFVADSGPKSTK
jgi:hypothetical protein